VNRIHDEQGVALISALLAVLIIGGLSVVFVSRATTESRAAGVSQNHETAIHTAEAAADVVVAQLNLASTYVSVDNAGLPVAPPPDAEERSWLRDPALLERMRNSPSWVEGDSGQAFAIRPRDAAGDPLDEIYAIGATPAFDAPRAMIRTIKLQVAQDNFIPRFAILTDGTLKFGGNAKIVSPSCDTSPGMQETCIADIHVNAGFENPGNSSEIQGQVRVAGGTCPAGVTAVNGCVDSDVQPYPVPAFTARSFYMRDLDQLRSDPDGREVDWWDLCPDGTVKEPSSAGPCTGEKVWPEDGSGNNFLGWDYRAAQQEWRGGAVNAGVFYVYRSNASIQGSDGTAGGQQRAVSVIVEGGTDASRTGNLEVTGNPKFQAALPDVLFITDRDLKMGGNAGGGQCGDGSILSGVVGVGEQVDIGGTVNIRGALLVRDATNESNKVTRNNASIHGTMCLTYDENLAIDLTGIWVITFWNEL
jgi:hypothetical protein